MKPGEGHIWKYREGIWKEKKIAPHKWTFKYIQKKVRMGRKAPHGSGFPIGGRLKWKIKATQRAVKIGPNTYKLVMTGVKYQGGYKKPRDRFWRK